MADYIKREDALRLMWNALYALEDKQEADHGLELAERKATQDGFEAGQQAVVNAPAADVVEVVRCNDCAYSEWRMITDEGHEILVCNNLDFLDVDKDFYCAYGRRRDDDR